MSTAVWADVGGTFTDCLVHRDGARDQIKILSSGLVRARVQQRLDPTTVRVESIPGSSIAGFWNGADASILTPAGGRTHLGSILSHRGDTLTIERPVSDASATTDFEQPQLDAVIELDAGIEAPVLGTRILLRTPLAERLPPLDVRLGSTRGTNALLTRRGATSGLLVTAGFGDVLRIGEQDRPDLFSLAIDKPQPLTEEVVEVRERLDARGEILQAIDPEELRAELSAMKRRGVESLAICFLHAHINDAHERIAQSIAEEFGFANISRSSEVAPLIKLVFRAETTTLDAYLNPILAGYVARVWNQFGGQPTCRLRLMTSGGNLVSPGSFRGRDSILSGPAGGVVGLGHVARLAGAPAAIGLDMGGTSTDVSRFEGHVGRRYQSRVAGIRVMTPMMDIETVAAGGGSICDYTDEGRLSVGPASAGADPGPACYGRGGPLTITDVNLLLGRIPESRFPFPLRREAAQQRLREIHQRIAGGDRFESAEQLADGLLNIAVTHMAEAVRTVSTAQGSDVRNMALVGFGGAAGQHLCRVAKSLGIERILDHPDAGILSAVGMGLADIGRVVTRGVYRLLPECTPAWMDDTVAQLQREAGDLLRDEHDGTATPRYRCECDLRYQGTESTLPLTLQPLETLAQRFHQSHHDTFGYTQPNRQVELVAVRCEATLKSKFNAHRPDDSSPRRAKISQDDFSNTSLWHRSDWIQAALVDRDDLRSGDRLEGPAMIAAQNSTLVVEPGWTAEVIAEGTIELTPAERRAAASAGARAQINAEQAASDLVLLEVVARRLQGIADSMGEVLRRTSISVNVKERRDYSCAVFRGDGSLVANAPHVPVHLGAMGHTVRHLANVFPKMSPGDCYLSNDPFAGGSHLPDVTAVTPVFCDEGGHVDAMQPRRPDFFVASRAHHAEIGGRTPGSMPPEATSLAEEGVVIRDFPLVQGGISHVDRLEQLLSSGPYPSRCVKENIADVTAQQAAGRHGARALVELTSEYGVDVVDTLMSRLLEVAADATGHWISQLSEGPFKFVDALDDGTEIGVTIQPAAGRLRIEFESGPPHPHGFNATPAIVTAAVLYVLRSVSGSDLPLCDGVLRKVDVHIPVGLLDPPSHADPSKCPAVVAGNVETSQRIVDVLLGALGVAAASQGTMNNVLIGDETFGYYETIGGGSGAMQGHHGAGAVHTHMTNTRITDAEVLEARLPLRLRRFAIRRGSGGGGQFRGGDGIIREFEFLKPLVVSLITGRRTRAPYGAASGQPGAAGINTWIKQGESVQLPPTVTIHVSAGDRLLIQTPGGGGWGQPS